MVPLGRQLIDMGFDVVATRGTAKAMQQAGLEVRLINKVLQGRPHVVDAMKNGEIALVINTTEGSQAVKDSYTLRRTALTERIPYYTTVAGAKAAVQAIETLLTGGLEVMPLQSYT